MPEYLKKYGARLIDAGYRIIPIPPGDKMPVEPKWQTIVSFKTHLKAWLDPARRHPTTGHLSHYERAGVGIITETTPAVDIDVLDAGLVKKLEDYISNLVGFAPTRVGRAPKKLMLYRTDEPFPKIQSGAWTDGTMKDGKPVAQRVEILSRGQQFVAYAIHPNTNKPYEWLYGDSPIATPREDLAVITEDHARQIIAKFEELAEAHGLTRITRQRDTTLAIRKVDYDNPFLADKHKTEISDDELHKRLMLIPNENADYDMWTNVGMALYHQYDGSEQGRQLWEEWSEQSIKHDTDTLEAKWPTFDVQGKQREPLTARYIIKLSDEEAVKIRTETFAEVVAGLNKASDRVEFKAVCEQIKHVEFDMFQRNQLVGLAQKAFKRLTDSPLTIRAARDMLRYEAPQIGDLPKWLQGWVYCEMDETFYSTISKRVLSKTGFDDVHARFLLSKLDVLEGKSIPEHVPSKLALNLHQIPVVWNRMYMPNEELLFRLNQVAYVNSYDARNVPAIPASLTKADKRNVEIVKGHLAHLFDSAKDRAILLDYMAYIIQSGRRVNYAVLIQGTEGDGKTFFFRLMACVLALENCNLVSGQALEEKYTSWAEGNQFVFFEEIKLHGHNRYDILNRVKPYITGEFVPIRRMQTDLYNVINTCSIWLATNFRDALPLAMNDTRYLVLFSRFQTEEAINEFNAQNPAYYDDLHAALIESPGAIRQWLLEHKIRPSFNAAGRAPSSAAKREMQALERSDESDALGEVIRERPQADMTKELLNATDLADMLTGKGAVIPYGKAMNRMLLDHGFSRLGKVRVGDNICLYWSQTPSKFRRDDGDVDPLKVKQWLADWDEKL